MRFRVLKIFSSSKTNLFIGIALIGLFIVLCLDFMDSQFSFHDILVESHGLIFDLFIFGIIFTIYDSLSSRKEKIKRYKEEIYDYKFWKSEEAMFRTRGLIKRLVELNEKELDLSHCYLANDISFSFYRNMINWKFSGANLKNSFFLMSDLENAHFILTNLNGATFNEVKLTNCKFNSASLYNTHFEKCTFNNTHLSDCLVKEENWFEILENNRNIGVYALKEKYRISKEQIKVDKDIMYKLIRK